jgi:hypothetical protein
MTHDTRETDVKTARTDAESESAGLSEIPSAMGKRRRAFTVAACLAVIAGAAVNGWLRIRAQRVENLPETFEITRGGHGRPLVEADGRTLLWAAGNPRDEAAVEWFDLTDSPIDPAEFSHGIGKDRIASIDQPEFVPADDPRLAMFGINKNTQIIGYAVGDEAKAYSVQVLNRHELVNDWFGGKPVTVGW